MAVLLLPASLGRLLGTCGRVTTGNGFQSLLELRLVLIRASLLRRFDEAFALALGDLLRCLCHVDLSYQASISHLLRRVR